ncbi:MAG: hypothetical protein M3P18_00230, partial [Actinomycetota bacterium]|nr:hypothetical protein [Actinomycetota bacterium]
LSEALMATVTPSRVLADAYTGSVERARSMLERYGPFIERSGSVEALPGLATARATLALVEGDYEDVFDQAARMEGATLACPTDFYSVVGHAALAGKDERWMSHAVEKLTKHAARSNLVTARRHTAEAGLMALAGDRARAIELYRAVIEEWRELQIPLDLALCQMDFAVAIGSPDGDRDAEEATSFFKRAGNDFLVARLDSWNSAPA